MDAWAGLLGAVIGGLLTMAGQQLTTRRDVTYRRRRDELLASVSILIALSEDYRNRVWEERHGLSTTVVAEWDLTAYRLAHARLSVLLTDIDALLVLEQLQQTGRTLGRVWRTQRADGPDVQAAWEKHKEAVNRFLIVGRRLLA
jgi:hypothetical protein